MNKTEWSTPQSFFDALNDEFHFTIDVCAVPHNAKIPRHFSPLDDALNQSWKNDVCWMNPPYGRGQNVYAWVKKAYETSMNGGGCRLSAPGKHRYKMVSRLCDEVKRGQIHQRSALVFSQRRSAATCKPCINIGRVSAVLREQQSGTVGENNR